MEELKETFKSINKMIENCDIDYKELINTDIDINFFDDYNNVRIVNSFLFNFSKIQDKIGAKLIKKTLYFQQEIDNENIPMKDALNLLEKLNIIKNVEDWEFLREIRNNLAHEYPNHIDERIENLTLTLKGYIKLKSIYLSLEKFCNF